MYQQYKLRRDICDTCSPFVTSDCSSLFSESLGIRNLSRLLPEPLLTFPRVSLERSRIAGSLLRQTLQLRPKEVFLPRFRIASLIRHPRPALHLHPGPRPRQVLRHPLLRQRVELVYQLPALGGLVRVLPVACGSPSRDPDGAADTTPPYTPPRSSFSEAVGIRRRRLRDGLPVGPCRMARCRRSTLLAIRDRG